MTSGSITVDGAAPEWTLGDRLRKARMHAGMRQRELGDVIGVSQVSVNKYEHDGAQPRRPVLVSWAMATGVALDWLVGEAEVADREVSAASPVRGGTFYRKFLPCPGSILQTSISSWTNYPDRGLPVAA